MMPADRPPSDQTVFFFGCDPVLGAALQAQAAAFALDLRWVKTVAGLMYAAARHTLRVLIVETGCLPAGRSPTALLDRLERDTGTYPRLIYLVPEGAARGRNEAAWREAHAVFPAPFDAAPIMARVVQALAPASAGQRFVLVVDARPEEGDEIVAALSAAGLLAERVPDPRRVVAALERARADLLLMDLNLPNDASRALRATIRNHQTLFDLPIIFISAEDYPDHEGEILRLGGDEYLARPLAAERMLAAVKGRLARLPTAAASGLGRGVRGGPGAPVLLTRKQLLRRLELAMVDPQVPAAGQAVLYLRIDESPGLAALDAARVEALRSLILELVHESASLALRGACQDDDGLYAWVRDESDAAVIELADAIRKGAADLVLPAGLARVSLSIGIGPFTPSADNALTLISRAQAACEQARRAGGNRVLRQRRGAARSGSGTPDQDPILSLLRSALAGQGFQLVYQPILSLRKSHHERYEVLLRLRTPDGEIMPPPTFLPVAAHYGLLPALDRWVLTRALETLRQERDAGRPTLLLIFQSSASLTAPGWLDWVRTEVLRLDLIRQRPMLEFNVRDILANEDHARVVFPELARLGIEVGLAAVTHDEEILGLVARRPIGTAKLARELVGRTETAQLKSIVAALHQRHARVIAAGIEDPETIGRVWSSGVDFIQGNFIQFPEDTLNFQFREGLSP